MKPAAIALTEKEREYARLSRGASSRSIPPEAQKQSQASAAAQPPAQARRRRPGRRQAGAARAAGCRGRRRPEPPEDCSRFASTSTNYFIDGRRSILDIYNAVRAECGNLQVGSTESKFAYVLGPEYPDVDLEAVANAIRNLEKEGVVEIITKPPSKAGRDKK